MCSYNVTHQFGTRCSVQHAFSVSKIGVLLQYNTFKVPHYSRNELLSLRKSATSFNALPLTVIQSFKVNSLLRVRGTRSGRKVRLKKARQMQSILIIIRPRSSSKPFSHHQPQEYYNTVLWRSTIPNEPSTARVLRHINVLRCQPKIIPCFVILG